VVVGTAARQDVEASADAPAAEPDAPAVPDEPNEWTWSHPSPQGNDLYAISGRENLALAAGHAGVVLRSVDAAAPWPPRQVPVSAKLRSVWVAPNQVSAFVAGEGGSVAHSADAGRTWTALDTGGVEDYAGIAAVGASVYVVGADGVVVRSVDGGSTWDR